VREPDQLFTMRLTQPDAPPQVAFEIMNPDVEMLRQRLPSRNALAAVLLIALGTAAFAGLGLLIGGTLPGLTTLAVANLVWLVLLALGGVVFPLTDYGAAQHVLVYLPTAALADGLRSLLRDGTFAVRDAVVLAVWAAAGLAAASRWFRWE